MTEDLYISDAIEQKLSNKHSLTRIEVEEAWAAYDGITLVDDREEHLTNPPTEWFLVKAPTGKILKVVFVPDDDGICYLKSAYEANQAVIRMFKRNGGKL